MRPPNLNEEKKMWKKGYKRVVCLDESGRGPLAGPVVAAAVMIKNPKLQAPNYKQIPITKIQNSKQKSFDYLRIGILNLFGICNLGFGISKLRDSKKLSPKTREKFYGIFTTHPGIEWGIGRVSEKVIDRINILEATKLAMKKAVKNLEKKLKKEKLKKVNKKEIKAKEYVHSTSDRLLSGHNDFLVDFLILDGNFKIDLPIPQKSIIKADEKVFSCAAASILAKVTRDRIMQRYHKKYPRYGFDKHKGYPTKYHLKMLKKYSPCKIHRKSFGPVNKILKIKNQKLKT